MCMDMSRYLKYAVIVIPIVGIVAIAAIFGKVGVRPRALPVIKPSAFQDAAELGYWAARQNRQKLFRNDLVFFGYDKSAPESLQILGGFLESSQKEGPAYDAVISAIPLPFNNIQKIILNEKSKAEEFHKAALPFFQNKKRVLMVLETPLTSKLIKTSFARTFEYQLGQRLASFSVIRQSESDLANLHESNFCSEADKLSFEKSESLRCLFLPLQRKLKSEVEKSSQKYYGAVDQFGLDDYVVYLYSN